MKKIYFILFALISSMSFAQTSDLLISKYGEGTSNNKFLEIYNGTGAAVNLDNYAFPNVSNDPAVPGEYEFWNEFPSGFMLADGDVFVIAHGSADASILAEADMTFNFLSNGDDGFALVANDGTFDDIDMDGNVDAGEMTGFTIIDRLGDWDGDPGSGWDVAGVTTATQDHTLTRKASICDPNNDWTSSAGTDASDSEWIVSGIDSGWGTIGSFVGCSTTPTLAITSPSEGAALNSGTLTVNIDYVVENAPGSSQINITVIRNGGAPMVTNDVMDNPFVIDPSADGDTFTVTVDLVDGGVLATATVNFSIAYPCDLQIGTITTTCVTETNDPDDLYNITIDYTGGGTSMYTIDTEGNGTLGGDDPSSVAAGTITINGVLEATNFTVTFTGNPLDSSCNFTRSINSPVCLGTLDCSGINTGDLIITEIMKNPSAVNDGDGEYFEIYNTTGNPIDIQGWDITDADSDTHTISSSVVVSAMGYAVLGVNSDFATNGGVNVDYEYSSYNLSNGSDEVQIECSGAIIDAVAYTDAEFPDTAGVSMELSDTAFDSVSNDTGSNWGDATSEIMAGGDLGTPGGSNDFTLSIEQFELSAFNVYPNPTSTGLVNITSQSNEAINVIVFDILGKQVIAETAIDNSLNVSSLKAGVYLLRITQNETSITKKLVIK